MKTEYLLPCSCGEKLHVDRSQAGLAIRCRCGKELTIPTLRGLEQLERPVPAATAPQREWGARQAALFLGGVLLAVALPAVALLWGTRPAYPQAELDAIIVSAGTLEELEGMPIRDTFELWKSLKDSPDTLMPPNYAAHIIDFNTRNEIYQSRIKLAIGTAIAGGIIFAIGLILPRSRKSSK